MCSDELHVRIADNAFPLNLQQYL